MRAKIIERFASVKRVITVSIRSQTNMTSRQEDAERLFSFPSLLAEASFRVGNHLLTVTAGSILLLSRPRFTFSSVAHKIALCSINHLKERDLEMFITAVRLKDFSEKSRLAPFS